MDESDPEKALKLYRQLLERFPDSYAAHFFIGKIYAGQGQLQAAEDEFLKTIALNSNLEEPRFELIALYTLQGKNEKILKMYKDILAISPRHVRASLELGHFYQRQGNAGAEPILTELGHRSLTDPRIVRTFVQIFLDPKHYDAATDTVKGLLKGAPESSDLHYLAGVAYDGKNASVNAIAHFEKVLPDSRFYKSAAVQIAFLYQDAGKIEAGIRHIQNVIAKFPEDSEMFFYLGTFYEEVEAYDKAVTTFKKGLQLDPENPKIYFRIGVVYDKQGHKELSIEAMRKVIDLNPKDPNALNYLGYTYADLGKNLDEAERLVREALKYKPNDGYITDSLGWVYFKKGLFENALIHLQEAVRLIPDDPTILEHLGDAYIRVNEKEKALDCYHRSLLKKKKETDRIELEKKIETLTGKGS